MIDQSPDTKIADLTRVVSRANLSVATSNGQPPAWQGPSRDELRDGLDWALKHIKAQAQEIDLLKGEIEATKPADPDKGMFAVIYESELIGACHPARFLAQDFAVNWAPQTVEEGPAYVVQLLDRMVVNERPVKIDGREIPPPTIAVRPPTEGPPEMFHDPAHRPGAA